MPAAIAIPAIVGAAGVGVQAYSAKKQAGAAEAAAKGFAPYGDLGRFALDQLRAGFAPGGEFTQRFQAPTAEEARNAPGYQFAVTEAQKAAERSAASKGTLLSGGFQRSLNRSIQGLADTNYQDVYNRSFNEFQTNQQNRYGRLLNLAGVGMQGVGGYNANMTDASAAGAAGTIGAFNTASSTIGDIFRYRQEEDILKALRAGTPPAISTASSYDGPRYGRMSELVN